MPTNLIQADAASRRGLIQPLNDRPCPEAASHKGRGLGRFIGGRAHVCFCGGMTWRKIQKGCIASTFTSKHAYPSAVGSP